MSSDEFVKHDQEKLCYDLVPADAFAAIVEVLTHGKEKYGADNWLNCESQRRYFAALQRHSWNWLAGLDLDKDSGLPVLAHAGCCILFLLAYQLRGMKETDDRPIIASTPTKPEIVCLCGSTKFIKEYNHWRQKLTQEGKIVLAIEVVTTQTIENDPQHCDPETKEMLDELHLRKIDMADTIMFLNKNDYIEKSTKNELEYAFNKEKDIVFLEKPKNYFTMRNSNNIYQFIPKGDSRRILDEDFS